MQSRRGPDYPNQDREVAVREGFQEEAMLNCWLRDQQREQAKGMRGIGNSVLHGWEQSWRKERWRLREPELREGAAAWL